MSKSILEMKNLLESKLVKDSWAEYSGYTYVQRVLSREYSVLQPDRVFAVILSTSVLAEKM